MVPQCCLANFLSIYVSTLLVKNGRVLFQDLIGTVVLTVV